MTIKNYAGFRNNRFKVLMGLFGLFFLSSVGSLYPAKAHADPPKEIVLRHNGELNKLEVSLVHKSSFPKYHYIKKIEIRRNGMPGGLFEYQSQPDKLKFSYSYDVPGVKGDEIDVTVSCSLYGSKTVSMTIGM